MKEGGSAISVTLFFASVTIWRTQSNYFPPLLWPKLLCPCRTPNTLYFFYNSCLHVCLPYKILSSLSEGPL